MLKQTMPQFSACASKLLVADAHSKQLDGQLQQLHSKHDQPELIAQVTQDDFILQDIIPRLEPYLDSIYRKRVNSALHK